MSDLRKALILAGTFIEEGQKSEEIVIGRDLVLAFEEFAYMFQIFCIPK